MKYTSGDPPSGTDIVRAPRQAAVTSKENVRAGVRRTSTLNVVPSLVASTARWTGSRCVSMRPILVGASAACRPMRGDDQRHVIAARVVEDANRTRSGGLYARLCSTGRPAGVRTTAERRCARSPAAASAQSIVAHGPRRERERRTGPGASAREPRAVAAGRRRDGGTPRSRGATRIRFGRNCAPTEQTGRQRVGAQCTAAIAGRTRERLRER